MAVIVCLFLLCPADYVKAEQKTKKSQVVTKPTSAPSPAATSESTPTTVSTPAPTSASTSAPSCIAVADVARQAAEVANFLQTMNHKLASSPEIAAIRTELPEVSGEIAQELAATMRVLQRQPALPTLQVQQQQWQQMQLKTTGWLTLLTKRSNELQDALNQLTDRQKLWAATLETARSSNAPDPILQQIEQTAAAIVAAQFPLKQQLATVLDLQSQVSDEVAKCGKALAEIAQVQQIAMADTLVRDSLPVWSPELWSAALPEVPGRVRSIAATYGMQIRNYIKDPSRRMAVHAGVFALLAVLFLACRDQIRKWSTAGEAISSSLRVFDHPFASAFAIALFAVTSAYWMPAPDGVQEIFRILGIAPVIILLRPAVGPRKVPGLYVIGLLFVIDLVGEIFFHEALIGQVLLMLESLAGIVTIIWFLRNLKPVYGEVAGSSRLRALQTGSVVFLLVLSAGLIATGMGYMRLARLMTPLVIAGGSLAVGLYAIVRILDGFATFVFRIWPLRTLRMVIHKRSMLERKTYRLIILAAIFSWFVRYLNNIGFLHPALSFGKTILAASLEHGPISISLGGVLEFVFTVWAAYLLSAFIRFVLGEDVYPRMRIAAGKSYAISSLLHYFILALGFTAAIAALGVNLTKLTVLTGALGVGIGFGLQSVVNNFVSGLILLFERPVHVGDTVEVGDLMGKVRSIGIRASTVHTRQGADIIVPNSQLISEKVTNWTLSDQLRRIDLPVGVNYGAAPREVIKVLENVAIANPNILSDPAPQCLFIGFGDSSINFELRAWTDQFDEWPRVSSELASVVYDAVYAAGLTFPSPQYDVRLLRDSEGEDPAAPGRQTEKYERT